MAGKVAATPMLPRSDSSKTPPLSAMEAVMASAISATLARTLILGGVNLGAS